MKTPTWDAATAPFRTMIANKAVLRRTLNSSANWQGTFSSGRFVNMNCIILSSSWALPRVDGSARSSFRSLRSTRSERPQIRKINHPRPREMATSRLNEVKASQDAEIALGQRLGVIILLREVRHACGGGFACCRGLLAE